MTIREYLHRRARLYWVSAWIFGILFVLASLGMKLATIDGLNGGNQARQSWYLAVSCTVFAGSGIGLVVTALLGSLRIRCPKCKAPVGLRPKQWENCPVCGVAFDSEV